MCWDSSVDALLSGAYAFAQDFPCQECIRHGVQVRSQLEALLAEKAALAAENERLARENGGLQELLRYSVQVGDVSRHPPYMLAWRSSLSTFGFM
jgi:hypothetical protein